MASHSSILAWRIPWTEEPGRLPVHRVAKSQTRLSSFTFTFHCLVLTAEDWQDLTGSVWRDIESACTRKTCRMGTRAVGSLATARQDRKLSCHKGSERATLLCRLGWPFLRHWLSYDWDNTHKLPNNALHTASTKSRLLISTQGKCQSENLINNWQRPAKGLPKAMPQLQLDIPVLDLSG